MGDLKTLNLLLFYGEEESFFSSRRQQVMQGKSFMLCSALFRNLGGIISDVLLSGKMSAADEVESALHRFYQEVNGNNEITDRPLSVKEMNFNILHLINGCNPGPDVRGMVSFCSEVLSLYGLIVTWLDPREVASGHLIAKQWLGDASNDFFFKKRCRQLRSSPTAVSGRFALVHDSPGILPLCWAELLNALQHEQKVSVCPYCHNIYRFPINNYQKLTCGQPTCRKAQLIHKHGGIEGYRAWEAERKKNSGGKRGRPRKTSSET